MTSRSLSARPVWALTSGAVLICALGCAQFRAGQERIRRATIDPLTEMFDRDSKGKKGGANNAQKTSAGSSTTSGSATTGAGRTPEGAFFVVPPHWTVNAHIEAKHMYRLAHDSASASIVITYEPHAAGADADARQDTQRAQHRKLFKRLPQYYKQVEYREWVDGEPAASYILTRVEGAQDKDSAKTTVIGYSITRGEDLFMVIGALPLDKADALHEDMRALMRSLKHPEPPAKPDNKPDDKPDDSPDDKPDDKDAAAPAEGGTTTPPAEGATTTPYSDASDGDTPAEAAPNNA